MRSWLAHPSLRQGLRVGLPVAIGGTALAISFGVLARPVMGTAAPIVMSAAVFAGSAQFGSLAVLAGGGGPLAAIAAGVLLNSRYVPMGVALGSSLSGGPLKRMIKAQAMVDFSWAAALRGGGRFDQHFLVGATLPMYAGWVLGTAIGVLAGDLIGDPERLGLDAIFPAFFLALLLGGEAPRSRLTVAAALLGGAIALVLIPLTPPGVPIIAACLAALIGLKRRVPGESDSGTAAEPESQRAPA